MNNRVVHFEIQVDDIERAKKFYTDVFGWGWQDWSGVTGSPYWGILTALMPARNAAHNATGGEPGINGGLLKRPCPAPKPGEGTNAFVCTIQVDDYDATEKKILAAGGIVALAKMNLGGMAWQGYFLDTEGNTFGIHQVIPKAQ